MIVETSRFGDVEVDGKRAIHFPDGLLGFSDRKSYVLLQPDEDSPFFWLQSTDAPELAFVVTDPARWVQNYEVPLSREDADAIGLTGSSDAEVLVIVNKRGRAMTANLQGPLVISSAPHRGQQVVLGNQQWTTRHQILDLEAA